MKVKHASEMVNPDFSPCRRYRRLKIASSDEAFGLTQSTDIVFDGTFFQIKNEQPRVIFIEKSKMNNQELLLKSRLLSTIGIYLC